MEKHRFDVPLMHSLADYMSPDQGLNAQPWHIMMML